MLLDFDGSFASDDTIQWRPYCDEDIICNRFSIGEWHKMVTDLHSDDEWRLFVSEYDDIVACYVLCRRTDNEPIAFLYVYLEDYSRRLVSVHGGGWGKSLRLSFLYYRGLISMIGCLFAHGFRVRTSCLKTNQHALRFLRSVGFVVYCHEGNFFKMWINHYRLFNSVPYRYLYKNNSD